MDNFEQIIKSLNIDWIINLVCAYGLFYVIGSVIVFVIVLFWICKTWFKD